jgi:glycosyltransferase involved in cell wall biosynthesis
LFRHALRILLASNASYLPPRGGSTRSNLAFLGTLAEHGHRVRVIAAAADTHTEAQRSRLERELAEQHLDPAFARRLEHEPVATGFFRGIEIVSVRDFMRNTGILAAQVREFAPDWLLVSSEDVSHTLLREAARSAPGRLIYLAHTPQFFPFGEASWHRDPAAAEAVRQAAAVIVISHAMADYVAMHLGREAILVHPPIYEVPSTASGDREEPSTESGDEPNAPSLSSIPMAMINPCAVKGISIFLALADLLPAEQFAALPGWGTTAHDLEQLRARPNIAVWPRVQRIDDFFSHVKVLLVPSLWLEGFGLVVMEAMLDEVPVIASNSGGLPEAKAGTDFVIPVRLIKSYEPVFDDRNMPRPLLPPQDIAPWLEALRVLLEDSAVYQSQRRAHQAAASSFVRQIDRYALERVLLNLPAPEPTSTRTPTPAPGIAPPLVDGRPFGLNRLSDDKRELLLKRLRHRHPART